MTAAFETPAPILAPDLSRLAPSEATAFQPELDDWLRPESDLSSAQDLPLLVGPEANSVRLVIREEDRIVSHAALCELEYTLQNAPTTTLRIGIVGAVATAPEARRRGHAEILVRTLQEHAVAQDLDLVVLWDDTPSGHYYDRFGFVGAGREVLHCTWRDLMDGLVHPDWVRPIGLHDVDALRRLHDTELAGVRRSRETWDRLLAIPRAEVFVLDRTGTPEAYAIVGKGIDLAGCVHDWAGEECALPALVAGIFHHRHDDRLTVMSASWKTTAHRALEFHGVERVEGILGMVWSPDPTVLARRCHRPAATLDQLLSGPDAIPFYLKGFDSM